MLYLKRNLNLKTILLGSQLSAGFVGQTSDKVKEILDSVRGGVLFIDEAYDLAKGSFSNEVMTTLLDAMTDLKYKVGL
jgi:hypothetical protein